MTLPALPDGATLDEPGSGGIPPLPPGATLDATPSPTHNAATDYSGPDPNEPDRMVDPETMQMVDAPRWKAAGYPSADSFKEAHLQGSQFAAGAGKFITGKVAGVRQIALHIGNHLGLVSDDDVQKNQDQIDETKKLDAPLLATPYGHAGYATAEAAPMLLAPELGATGLVSNAAIAAGLGATEPVATGESRGQNAIKGATGAALGYGVGKVVGAGIGAFGGLGGRQSAVKILDGEGIPTSVAQKTGAKAAQHLERASAITSDQPAEFFANQGDRINAAFMRRIGVDIPTDEGMNGQDVLDALPDAKKAITDTMDDVAARTQVKLDNPLFNALSAAEKDTYRTIPDSDQSPIFRNIQDILENATTNNGYLDGTFVQKLNSNLGALSRSPSTAPVAEGMQEALHDALQRSASPGDVPALIQARQQYRALKQIEPAIALDGNVSIQGVASQLRQKKNTNLTLYGKGDQSLVNLTRALKTVVPERLANSGTPERTIPALAAMEIAASGEPIKAGLKTATGAVGLNAAGNAMRSQGLVGQYLSRGLGPLGRAAAPIVKRIAPAVGVGNTMSAPDEQQPLDIARASGGKVDVGMLADRLINRWKAAKKATNETTKPLLNVPDETIAKALDIAQEHI
jgi:hypothetical protein